jgi:hypothetical protein
VKKFYGLRGGYHPLIALEEGAASRAQGLSEEEQAEAKPGRHLPPGLGGVKKPWRYYHKIYENREQKEAKSNPCSVSSLAPRRPEEKKDILKDALPDVKAYVNFARSQKPSLSARIKALNLSPEEETVFEKFEDAITREYMDVPILWAEEHYDISTLQNWLNRKEEKEGNPFSRTPFIATALGSCRKLYGEADSTIKKYEQDRETKRIANFEAHQELCPKIWILSYEECEQELAKLAALVKPIERFATSDKQGIPLDEKGSSICLRILTHPDFTPAQKKTLVYYALDKLSYADYPHAFFTARFAKLQTDLSWLHHKLYFEALAKPSRIFTLQEENTIWHYFIDHYPDSLFMLLHSMLAHQYPNLIGFVGIWRQTVAAREDTVAINAFFIRLLGPRYGKNPEFDNALKKMIRNIKQDDMQGVYQIYAGAGLDNEVAALFDEWDKKLGQNDSQAFTECCFEYLSSPHPKSTSLLKNESLWHRFVTSDTNTAVHFFHHLAKSALADEKLKQFVRTWRDSTTDPLLLLKTILLKKSLSTAKKAQFLAILSATLKTQDTNEILKEPLIDELLGSPLYADFLLQIYRKALTTASQLHVHVHFHGEHSEIPTEIEDRLFEFFGKNSPDRLIDIFPLLTTQGYPSERLLRFIAIWREQLGELDGVLAVKNLYQPILNCFYGQDAIFDARLKALAKQDLGDNMEALYALYNQAGYEAECLSIINEWHANLKQGEEARFCYVYQSELQNSLEEFKPDEAVWTTFVAARQAKGLFDLFVKRNISADIKMKFLTVWAGNTRDPQHDADVISAFYRSNKLIDASQDEAFEANETLLWRQLTALDPNQGKKLFMDLVASYCNETKLLHFIHVWMSPLDPAVIRRHYNETIKPVITAERCRFEKYLPEITRLTQKPILEKAANKVVIDPSTQEWMTSGFSFFKYFDRPGPNDRYKQICKQPAAAQSIIAAEEKELAEAINNKLKASPGNSVFKFG